MSEVTSGGIRWPTYIMNLKHEPSSPSHAIPVHSDRVRAPKGWLLNAHPILDEELGEVVALPGARDSVPEHTTPGSTG